MIGRCLFCLLLGFSLYAGDKTESEICGIPFQNLSVEDSLSVQNPEILRIRPAEAHGLTINRSGMLGVSIMLACGALSIYYHNEAEHSYERYLVSGDLELMDKWYQQAVKFDRLTGWCFAGFEVGFVITLFSFNR